MNAATRIQPSPRSARTLASLALLAGAGGMAVSFAFLASASHLDVIAGAAGFVAGAILVAGGLVSAAILGRPRPADPNTAAAAGDAPPLAVGRWLAPFRRNHADRPEPDWA